MSQRLFNSELTVSKCSMWPTLAEFVWPQLLVPAATYMHRYVCTYNTEARIKTVTHCKRRHCLKVSLRLKMTHERRRRDKQVPTPHSRPDVSDWM